MLYLVTNRKLIAPDKYFDTIKDAIKAGVDSIILREKDLSTVELRLIAMQIKSLIKNNATEKVDLIINSDEEVALELDADGLHLGFDDFKAYSGSYRGRIGVSVHSVEEAIFSEYKGANYLLAGHVFPTKSKEGLEGRGIDFIKSIKQKVSIPVIAIGGITDCNATVVINAGADGIAVMSYIMGASNPYKSASIIRECIVSTTYNQ